MSSQLQQLWLLPWWFLSSSGLILQVMMSFLEPHLTETPVSWNRRKAWCPSSQTRTTYTTKKRRQLEAAFKQLEIRNIFRVLQYHSHWSSVWFWLACSPKTERNNKLEKGYKKSLTQLSQRTTLTSKYLDHSFTDICWECYNIKRVNILSVTCIFSSWLLLMLLYSNEEILP